MQGHVGSLLEVGTGFHPELTGLENIYLNGSILGMSKQAIDLRIDEIIDFAEVPTFLDTPVKRYSSGMRVRLAFAVAAHLEPEILIIDEVLSVGDYGFQAKCLDKMRSVAADDGRTVLYVSHNLVTVEHLCRRTLLLVDGKLAFDGPTEETIERYLHLFPRAERGDIAGVFDLATADRSMNESLRGMFKRLVLRPNGGQPSDVVRMGDSLQIEIDLEDLEDNDIVILVGSGTSETIFRITSRMRPLGRTHEPCKDETIVIDIPNVMLTPGEYHLTVSVWGRNAKLQDDVHHAAEFTVIPADVIGTGYGFSPRDGSVYVPFEWHLEPAVPPGQGAGVNIAADLSDL
jgi:lipopolysaccharide transport system ATP-binding protein